MRYFLAMIVPVAFVVLVFSTLAILTATADAWNPRAQGALTDVVVWWARYWWILALVLASACLIAAVIHDAHAPAKRNPR